MRDGDAVVEVTYEMMPLYDKLQEIAWTVDALTAMQDTQKATYEVVARLEELSKEEFKRVKRGGEVR